jgi:hypothetical protein
MACPADYQGFQAVQLNTVPMPVMMIANVAMTPRFRRRAYQLSFMDCSPAAEEASRPAYTAWPPATAEPAPPTAWLPVTVAFSPLAVGCRSHCPPGRPVLKRVSLLIKREFHRWDSPADRLNGW